MPNEPIITCDACKKQFKLTVKQVKNRQSGDLIFRYIVCSECGAAFISTTTDTKFRKLIRKGQMNSKQYEALTAMMNEKHFWRFKELVPTAFDIYAKGGKDDASQ